MSLWQLSSKTSQCELACCTQHMQAMSWFLRPSTDFDYDSGVLRIQLAAMPSMLVHSCAIHFAIACVLHWPACGGTVHQATT